MSCRRIFRLQLCRGRRGRDRMVVGFTTMPMQSESITTDVVGSNLDQGDMYVQHYVIKFVSDLRHVGSFLWVPPVSSTNKTDHHDVAEILLKMELNTIKQTNKQTNKQHSF